MSKAVSVGWCITLMVLAQSGAAQDVVVEEVIVTGSYIRGTPSDAPSPVDVIRRDEMDALTEAGLTESGLIRDLDAAVPELLTGGAGYSLVPNHLVDVLADLVSMHELIRKLPDRQRSCHIVDIAVPRQSVIDADRLTSLDDRVTCAVRSSRGDTTAAERCIRKTEVES